MQGSGHDELSMRSVELIDQLIDVQMADAAVWELLWRRTTTIIRFHSKKFGSGLQYTTNTS